MPALPTSQRVHNDEDEDGGEEDDMGSKCQHTQGTAARPKSQIVKDDECEYNNDDEGDRRQCIPVTLSSRMMQERNISCKSLRKCGKTMRIIVDLLQKRVKPVKPGVKPVQKCVKPVKPLILKKNNIT